MAGRVSLQECGKKGIKVSKCLGLSTERDVLTACRIVLSVGTENHFAHSMTGGVQLEL